MSAGLEILYHTSKNIALRSVCKPVIFPLSEQMQDLFDDLVYAIRYKDRV